MKNQIIFIIALLYTHIMLGQGVGINTAPALAAPSAELEVKSSTRGILVPSLASTAAVSSPALGLIIYNQSGNCFSYYVGSGKWIDFPSAKIPILSDKDADTKIYAEKTVDEDKLRFASGMGTNTETEIAILDSSGLNLSFSNAAYKSNSVSILTQNQTKNTVSAGRDAGKLNTSGTNNTFIGYNAGTANTNGTNNVMLGWKAGAANNASNNTLVGRSAGKSINTGNQNTVIGDSSLVSNTVGLRNVVIGASSANTAVNSNNIAIGASTASALTTGNGTITIGSNIAGVNTDSTITIGNLLKLHQPSAKVTFNNAYSFPTTAGTAGDILRLNASNQLLWASRMPRDVAGALADIQPYSQSFASKLPANMTTINNVYLMNVMSFATATLSYIETYVDNTGGTASVAMLGIYDASTNALLAYSNPAIAANYVGEVYDKLLDPTTGLATIISVDVSKSYYLGIFTQNTTTKFLNVTDTYNQSITQNALIPSATKLRSSSLDPSNTYSTTAIWVHAF